MYFYWQKSNRINGHGKSIAEISDYIIFDSVKKEKSTYELFIDIFTDSIMLKKKLNYIILDKITKKHKTTDVRPVL